MCITMLYKFLHGPVYTGFTAPPGSGSKTFRVDNVSISGLAGRHAVPSRRGGFYYLQNNKYIFKVVLVPPLRPPPLLWMGSLYTGCVTSSAVPEALCVSSTLRQRSLERR